MKDTMGLIFAYQNDEHMKSLTQKRALSSIPFGGRYRIVDFTLSNMVNSGITKVGIITRNNYQSLMDHLGAGKEWDLSRKNGGLYMLPPFFSKGTAYRGKMEALRNAEAFIRRSDNRFVILASADVVCNMDLNPVFDYHVQKGADITLVYQNKVLVDDGEGGGSGCVIETDGNGRVMDVAIDPVITEQTVKSSQEIVIMSRALLESLINECTSHNLYGFHRDVLQRHLKDLKIYGYEYEGYCAKINSIASYFKANMDLLNGDIRQALFYQPRQIFTKIRDQAPSVYRNGSKVSNSLIADGCVVEGTVENSILFRGVQVKKGAVVRNSIIMQDTEIQEGAELVYTISDKDVVIREKSKLYGYELYPMVLAKGSVV